MGLGNKAWAVVLERREWGEGLDSGGEGWRVGHNTLQQENGFG